MISGNAQDIVRYARHVRNKGKNMVRIITDSAADLEPQEYKKLNVTCIPLCVSFGNTEYEENVNLSKQLFYQLLE